VDDEDYVLDALAAGIRREYDVVTATSAERAIQIMSTRPTDLILCDQRLPEMSGIQLLEWVWAHHPKTIRLLITGLTDFEYAVEAINRSHVYRYLFKPWRIDELMEVLRDAARAFHLERRNEVLVDQLRALNEELEHRVRQRTLELEEVNRQLQQRNSMLEKLALTDELTGLYNRRALEQVLQQEITRRNRYPSPLALGLVDADHFKEVNTRYLYPGGDQALIALARTLSSSVRTVDTVGRIGGEEFLVVAPMTDGEGAQNLAERIRRAVEQMRVHYQGQEIRLTVSVGFAVIDADGQARADSLMHEAAAALSEAKGRGRNCSIIRQSEAALPAMVEAV
jgi:diguanylate cyclase (GGDEF)-like protein